MRTFLHDEDIALTSAGTFITFRIQVKSRGINLTEVPLNNYRYDLQVIANHIADKTKIIYLANPNNPTGNIFTDEEFQRFMEQVPKRTLVLLDEAYFEFAADNPDYPDSMKYRFDNVISLRTFSKAYGLAGVRIGYGFAHENLINNLMKIKLPFEPSSPAQAAALAALDDYEFLNKSIELARNGRKFFYDFFKRLGIDYLESQANFVTIILDSEIQVNHIYDQLLKRGIIVRPLNSFGLSNCIRITTGLEEENSIFAENFEQIFKST
jgi:histidinol-phosphate aminotransferase